jgi:hypothetical protein
MKKIILLIITFTLGSCSVIERNPSSDNFCSSLVKDFFYPIRNEGDIAFLKERAIVDFLLKQQNEKEEIRMDLQLIKRKYPHMNSDQVIGHFKLLRNSCERIE